MKKYIIMVLCVLSGCASIVDKKGIDFVGYNEERNVSTYGNVKQRESIKLGSKVQAVKKEAALDLKKYNVEIFGSMEFDVFVRYVANLLGYVYVKKVDEVYNLVDIDIVGKMNRIELLEVLKTVGSVSGVEVSLVDGVLVLGAVGSGGIGYLKYLPLNYVDNSLVVIDVAVKMFRIPGGIVLFGDKLLVVGVESLLKSLDVDYMLGVDITLIPYDIGICELVKKSMDVVWKSDIAFIAVGSEITAMIMRESGNKAIVLEMLEKFRLGKLMKYYYIPIRSAKLKSVHEKLELLLPGVEVVLGDNCLVVKKYDDYINVVSVMRGLDYVERMVYLEVYLLDIQSRNAKNIGFDIKKVGSNGFSTALRSSVGLGLYSNFGDFSAFFNYLVTEFDGKVLSSPYCILQNKTKAVMNFGQRIPTLQSKSSTTAGELIQNVEYTDIGLGLNIAVELVGGCIYSDLSISNSSVLEDTGVEGNPQFSDDNISVSLVMKSGNVAVIAGLKRQGMEKSRRSVLFPFSYFRKKEKREMLVCLHAKEISFDDTRELVLQDIKNLFDNSMKK